MREMQSDGVQLEDERSGTPGPLCWGPSLTMEPVMSPFSLGVKREQGLSPLKQSTRHTVQPWLKAVEYM